MKKYSLRVKMLADKVFDEYMKGTLEAVRVGVDSLVDVRLRSISYEASAAAAQKAETYKADAESLLAADVRHDDEMLLDIVIFNASNKIDEHKFYWNRFDYEPFFNYLLLQSGIVHDFPISSREHLEAYTNLLSGFADLAADMLEKAKGHLERGILMAKPLAKLSADVFDGFVYKDPENCPFALLPHRTTDVNFDVSPYRKLVDACIMRLSKTCGEMRDFMRGDYCAAAPENIGYMQYENGKEYYACCVKRETTIDLVPEKLFDLGCGIRQEIEESMTSIRKGAGYDCSREEFTAKIMKDASWKMDTPEEFGRRLNECVTKMAPLMDKYFGIPIKTDCAAVRLSPDMEPYYFNGIYMMANPVNERGEYRFNGLRMEDKNPMKTESLGYHELIPGHHYQQSVVRESEDMHPLVKTTVATAFSEGWAEYAAAFAGEIGLYSSPLSEYGRLEMDLYVTNYIIIDSAINVMGWSIGELEEFMAPYLPDYKGERLTYQLMRISQAMPAFSIGYKIGSLKMMDYRREAEERLGNLFDIREFHTIVHEWGAPPLYILKKHIDWYIDNRLEGTI